MEACKVCLKPHAHCTCANAHKKHAAHVNKLNEPKPLPDVSEFKKPKEVLPEDKIVGNSRADVDLHEVHPPEAAHEHHEEKKKKILRRRK